MRVLQEIIVALIIIWAIVWLVRNVVKRARGGGCECERAPTCPYAGGPGCRLAARDADDDRDGSADD